MIRSEDAMHVVVMGVSGCGKTTVGQLLAARLGARFVDGDSLHSAANVAKMHAGVPLTDADRAPWLERVGETLAAAGDAPLVVACSALKRVYRDTILRRDPSAVFLHLAASRTLIAQRLEERHGHFMPAALLASQFAALEPLSTDEPGYVVDVAGALDEVVNAALRVLETRRLL